MNPTELVHSFGYYAIVVGTFFEGELIMLAAGMAASAGLLNLPGVILAGMAGIFASDTFCFLLGRFAGGRLKDWFPRLHARLGGIFKLIERHDDKLAICFQFFPGLCTITPVAFGMSAISTARFMLLDFIGNALWTLVFCLGGYTFGTAFERLAREANAWLGLAFAAVLAAGFGLWRAWRALGRRIARID